MRAQAHFGEPDSWRERRWGAAWGAVGGVGGGPARPQPSPRSESSPQRPVFEESASPRLLGAPHPLPSPNSCSEQSGVRRARRVSPPLPPGSQSERLGQLFVSFQAETNAQLTPPHPHPSAPAPQPPGRRERRAPRPASQTSARGRSKG